MPPVLVTVSVFGPLSVLVPAKVIGTLMPGAVFPNVRLALLKVAAWVNVRPWMPCSAAVPVTVRAPLATEAAEPRLAVPWFRLVAPVMLLAAARVVVPAPARVRPPVPLTTLLMVVVLAVGREIPSLARKARLPAVIVLA